MRVSSAAISEAMWLSVAAVLALSVGVLALQQPTLAVLAAIVVLALAGCALPAPIWAAAAVTAAVTFKGFASVAHLSGAIGYVDIPLAWGALAIALLRRRGALGGLPVGAQGRLLLLFIGCSWLSFIGHPSELARPLIYVGVFGEPFAIILAILIDQPGPNLRRWMYGLAIGLALVQIPITAYQFERYNHDDNHVAGTLAGASGGQHVISAVAVVAAILLIASSHPIWVRLLSIPLLLIPFIADAKQVILALPFAVLPIALSAGLKRGMLIAATVGGMVIFLLHFSPSGHATDTFLASARSGHGGKQVTFDFVKAKLVTSPGNFIVGLGPAETVSRTAQLTTDPTGPLASLGLSPARYATEVGFEAQTLSGGGTSLNASVSSALGLLGDLGVLGFACYIALLLTLMGMLRSANRSPERVAALGGWCMLFVLGFVFDWWEQPPITAYVAFVTALAVLPRGRTELPVPNANP